MGWGKVKSFAKKAAKATGKSYKAIKKEAAPVLKVAHEDAKGIVNSIDKKTNKIFGGVGNVLNAGGGLLNSVSGALPLILGTVVVVAGVYAYSNYSSGKRAAGQVHHSYRPYQSYKYPQMRRRYRC